MRAAFISACFVCAAAGTLSAEPFRKGPYIQNVSSSSVTVMWESSESSGAGSTVRLLGVTPPREITVPASEDSDLHEVVIDGLSPGSRYRYAVDSGGETEIGEFSTAPEPGAPVSFVVFGDTRSNPRAHQQVVERIRREVPDFLLQTGDLVDQGDKDSEWQDFFEIERDLLRDNVLFPSLGNHDRQGRGRTADNFRKYFSLPENAPDPERYYAFTYGSVRVLVLDSNAYSFALTDQTAWIEEQLQQARMDPAISHIFVAMHHPPFSISLHGGHKELRERWTPLFEQYGVTAVFSGHDHVYSRAEQDGIRYFVSGGGGAPLYPRSRNPSSVDVDAMRYFERVNHYVRVQVVGSLVEVTAIRADGTIIENVSWKVHKSYPKALAAGSPAIEESHAAEVGESPMDHAPNHDDSDVMTTPSVAGVSQESSSSLLGHLGAALMLLAGGVLFFTLRG